MNVTAKYDGVVILGAGLSGLGCALQLPGSRMFEAKSHLGGHAWSHPTAEFHFDEGAHICHSRDEGYLKMIFETAAEVAHVAKSKVLNWRAGGWLTYPVQNHLHELNLPERTAALTDFVNAQLERAGQQPANYLDWCLNQYGRFLTENFYAAYTAKYWRTPMEQLSTDWLSGRLLPAQVSRVVGGALGAQPDAQAVFAAFNYPKCGGYFSFYRNLYGTLNVTLNAQAVEVDLRRRTASFADGSQQQFSELVSSIPLPKLVDMIKDAPASVRDAAALLRHTQLLCVNVVINRPALTDLHWFYIYDQDIEASRVSVASNLGLEPAAKHKTALQAEVFRRENEAMNVESIVDNSLEYMSRILKFNRSEVEAVQTVKVPYAYIVSDLNRANAVEHIGEWLQGKGVHVIGMLGKWKFIWSDAAFRDGVAAGQALAQSRR